jgi:putative phosphoesterase
MLVGILSDTHDNAASMAAAMALLRQRGCRRIIHCGDVGSPRILDHLAGLDASFVWGNCDWDRPALERHARCLGITCHGAFGEFDLDGAPAALLHGDDHRLKARLLAEQRHAYLLQGHTHLAEDRRIGRVRLINPGALHRANPRTVAILDTASGALELLAVSLTPPSASDPGAG